MSLFVVLKSTDIAGTQNSAEFHIPFAPARIPTLVNEEIDYIQADGDELDHILFMFLEKETKQYTIPVPMNKRVVRWYGDLAKTIYFNLR